MSEKLFYVYEHWRPDKGVCFYVGKGRGWRAWRMAQRNPHHTAIVSKLTALGLAVDVRVIATDLLEDVAYALEMERISLHNADTLANQTKGGRGLPDPKRAVRDEMSRASKNKWDDPDFRERHSKAVKAATNRPGHREKLSAARKGKKLSPEQVAKVSAALKGRKRPGMSERLSGAGNPFWGKRHNADTLERIAAKKRGSKLSESTKAKMREAQRERREREKAAKPPKPSKEPRAPFRHSPETIERMKIIAKARGVSDACRDAQRKALTGRKRKPFTEETLAKMRIAAKAREETRRLRRQQAQ